MQPQPTAIQAPTPRLKPREEIDTVTIRFCGDSGDGMQLTGMEFTRASAIAGNDLQTFPDYPAEIRAPAGTLPGVSGFQIQFSHWPVYTPGDQPDVLVAMNPAALKTNLSDLPLGGMLVLNAATKLSGLRGFPGSYPIPPASDILHELSRHKNFDFATFQAEDEIAAVNSAIGAAFGGCLGITSSSGPGVALKQEAIGLAVMTELPVIVCNIQRGGPSTGLPTKTEQADLLQALYGRNGECPVPVIAASSPSDCFEVALEAARIAIRYMTPVFLLSDGYIANGQEPWRIPDVQSLKPIPVHFRTDPSNYFVYDRDPTSLARAWVKPGDRKSVV